MEAGWSSGSLNTASHAAALARPLGAVPGSITSAQSAGCHRLLREYGAVCVTSAADVGELLGLAGEAGGAASFSDPRLVRVADALGTRVWRTVEEVAVSSGLALDDVEAALGALALEGRVEREGAAWRLGAA